MQKSTYCYFSYPVLILFLFANAGFTNELKNQSVPEVRLYSPVMEYSAGAPAQVYVMTEPALPGATVELGISFPVDLKLEGLTPTDLQDGRYFYRWRTDGYYAGEYIVDATLTTPLGDVTHASESLKLDLVGPYFFAKIIEVSPKRVIPGEMVQVSIAYQGNPLTPRHINGLNPEQMPYQILLGNTVVSPISETTNFMNFLFKVPEINPGSYPVRIYFPEYPDIGHQFRKEVLVIPPGEKKIDLEVLVDSQSNGIGRQMLLLADLNGTEPVFGWADFEFSGYAGSSSGFVSLPGIPMRNQLDPTSFYLDMNSEGFGEETSCLVEVFFLIADGDILSASKILPPGSFEGIPSPAAVCRQNLFFLDMVKFSLLLEGNDLIQQYGVEHVLNMYLVKDFPLHFVGVSEKTPLGIDWNLYYDYLRYENYDMEDLFPIFRGYLSCPESGEYFLNQFIENATCSVGNSITPGSDFNDMLDDHILHFQSHEPYLNFYAHNMICGKQCSLNLKHVSIAKFQWGIFSDAGDTASPALMDLEPFLKGHVFQHCGFGGATTSFADLATHPSCSLRRGPGDHGVEEYFEKDMIRERRIFQGSLCNSFLRWIQRAKIKWARENNQHEMAVPSYDVLIPYLPNQKFPTCPAGGSYTIGDVGSLPICSLRYVKNEHVIDDESILKDNDYVINPPDFDFLIEDTVSPVVTNIRLSARNVLPGGTIEVWATVYDDGLPSSLISSADLHIYNDYHIRNEDIRYEMSAVDGIYDSTVEEVHVIIDTEEFDFLFKSDLPLITIYATDSSGNQSDYSHRESSSSKTFHLNYSKEVTSPIRLLKPDGINDRLEGDTFEISWEDGDPFGDNYLYLYYRGVDEWELEWINTEDQYPDGIKLADTRNSYSWDISNITPGVYYIVGISSDEMLNEKEIENSIVYFNLIARLFGRSPGYINLKAQPSKEPKNILKIY